MSQFHTERATIGLRKLAEMDVAFASMSLFCKHRDATEDFVMHGAPKDPDGKQMTAPAWTDGKTIFYGPGFGKFSLQEKMGVCAHEILHIALRHISRAKKLRQRFGGEYNPFMFNVATDAIINQTLLLNKMTLPRPCIILEELFKEVFDEVINPKEVLGEWNAERLYIRLMNKIKENKKPSPDFSRGIEAIDPNSAFGKKLIKFLEDKEFEADFFPSDFDADGSADADNEDFKWDQIVKQALSRSQAIGKGLGTLGRLLGDLPVSRVPWESELRSAANKALTRSPRMSYARPTRSFLALDAHAVQTGGMRPAYEMGISYDDTKPRIAVGVDNSGSVGDELNRQFASQIAAIGRRTGAEIHVFVFDTVVRSQCKMVGHNAERQITDIEFVDGGGTSFVDVIEKAQEIDPSMIVILTDLLGPFGEAPKSVPVIWAIPQENPPGEPPFGRVLSLAQ